jgi:hypothetical protein
MKKLLFFVLAASLFACQNTNNTQNQTEEEKIDSLAMELVKETAVQSEEVQAIIKTLFDGVRAGNKDEILYAMTDDAVFTSSRKVEGEDVVKQTSGIDFADSAGQEREEAWDERLGEMKVTIDESIAKAEMEYKFYIEETYSHRGDMLVDLVLVDGAWKVKKVFYTVVKDEVTE